MSESLDEGKLCEKSLERLVAVTNDDNKKICVWCSKRYHNVIQHDVTEFGMNNDTGGLKPSCKKSHAIRAMEVRDKVRAKKLADAPVGSTLWFKRLHKFDHSILTNTDRARQDVLRKSWRTDKQTIAKAKSEAQAFDASQVDGRYKKSANSG